MMSESSSDKKKEAGIKNAEDLSTLNKSELIDQIQNQKTIIEKLEMKINNYENPEKDKVKISESSRRENVLVMRLATKEQEVQDLTAQISNLHRCQLDAQIHDLRKAFLDPSINLLYEKFRKDTDEMKKRLEQAESELSAWKFTPDSQQGKRLIARCRLLLAENQDLGKQLSQGRTAQLEAELALQKQQVTKMKASQEEMNEFVIQLDEEVEGMQSTIQALQQRLLHSKKKEEKLSKQLAEAEDKLITCQRQLENDTSSPLRREELIVDDMKDDDVTNYYESDEKNLDYEEDYHVKTNDRHASVSSEVAPGTPINDEVHNDVTYSRKHQEEDEQKSYIEEEVVVETDERFTDEDLTLGRDYWKLSRRHKDFSSSYSTKQESNNRFSKSVNKDEDVESSARGKKRRASGSTK